MSQPQITVYSQPSCVQCTATERKLNDLGVEYTKVDVLGDEEAIGRLKELGFLKAPVVEAPNGVWAGFNPIMLTQAAAMVREM